MLTVYTILASALVVLFMWLALGWRTERARVRYMDWVLERLLEDRVALCAYIDQLEYEADNLHEEGLPRGMIVVKPGVIGEGEDIRA